MKSELEAREKVQCGENKYRCSPTNSTPQQTEGNNQNFTTWRPDATAAEAKKQNTLAQYTWNAAHVLVLYRREFSSSTLGVHILFNIDSCPPRL